MDISSISQLLRDSKVQGNLARHPLAASLGLSGTGSPGPGGFMAGADSPAIPSMGKGGSSSMFQDMVAMAQAQAEMNSQKNPVSREAARTVAQMRAMSMQNELLESMAGFDDNGESRAGSLVAHMNIEALMSADSFGNLLGSPKGGSLTGGADSGRSFSPGELQSWRQKNMGLGRGGATDDASPAGRANLQMPYGLNRAPGRKKAQEGLDEKDPALEGEAAMAAEQEKDAREAKGGAISMEAIDKIVGKVSVALGIDPNLVKAVIKTESNFRHTAVSKAGAKGLMQLMPGTARELGVEDPFNPIENIWGGARYLKKMLDRHGGNINKALASYNWGPGNFDRYGQGGNMPRETKNYISIVNQNYARFKKSGSSVA